MTCVNGYFHVNDKHVKELDGYQLPSEWWSRPYEYAFALDNVEKKHVVMDLGTGWMYRPLKDALARRCKTVYAIDADARIKQFENYDNVYHLHLDFTDPKQMNHFGKACIDRMFCISVLEDLIEPGRVLSALREMRRMLKPDGKAVITFDTPYNPDMPCPRYPGMDVDMFSALVDESGLVFDAGHTCSCGHHDDGEIVHHSDWNLAVYHCVLVKP